MGIVISWQQAEENYEQRKDLNLEEEKRLIKEIEESNFQMLDANDVNYYASALNEVSNRLNSNGKPDPYTPNDVRRMNMEAKGLNSFDLLNTFMDDDEDFIIDFY